MWKIWIVKICKDEACQLSAKKIAINNRSIKVLNQQKSWGEYQITTLVPRKLKDSYNHKETI